MFLNVFSWIDAVPLNVNDAQYCRLLMDGKLEPEASCGPLLIIQQPDFLSWHIRRLFQLFKNLEESARIDPPWRWQQTAG